MDNSFIRSRRCWLALLGVLVLAAGLRLHGISYGLPAVNDPDELIFELGATKMLIGHTLNPGWFGHPATTTMYLLAVINVLVFFVGWCFGQFDGAKAFVQAIYHDPGWVMLPHRVAMTAFAVATVALTARLAGRVWHEEPAASRTGATFAGVAAALFLAVDPVHMAWSQVIRSDIMACTFLLLCQLAAIDIAERGKRGDWVRAALWLALAVATKWPFALGVLSIAGAAALRFRSGSSMRSTATALLLTGLLAVAFLIAVSPFLVLDYQTVLTNLAGEAQPKHLGATGGTPLQNLGWYARHAFLPGVGPLGLALATAGFWRARRNELVLALLLPVGLGFVAALAFQHIVWDRWALPLLPLLAVLASGGLLSFLRALAVRLPARSAWLATSLVLLAATTPMLGTSWLTGTERLDDTRQLASRWAHAHIPDGATILIEHFGFDLLDRNWALLFPLGDKGCVDARQLLAGKVQYDLIEGGRSHRSNIDYGTLDPNMRPSCRANWAILTQADRYAADATRFPEEAAAYQALIASGRVAAVFRPVAGRSSGPVVRIIRLGR